LSSSNASDFKERKEPGDKSSRATVEDRWTGPDSNGATMARCGGTSSSAISAFAASFTSAWTFGFGRGISANRGIVSRNRREESIKTPSRVHHVVLRQCLRLRHLLPPLF